MKCEILCAASTLFLASCAWFQSNPHDPVYKRPDSALDPVGMAQYKRDARDRASKGVFEVGAEVSVVKGQAVVFDKNPEVYASSAGYVEKADKVKVVANDGSFVRVELPDGKVGYIRETDLVNPKAQLMPMIGPDGQPSLFDDSTFVGNLPAIGEDYTTAILPDGSGGGDGTFVQAARKTLETRMPGAPAPQPQEPMPKSSKVSDLPQEGAKMPQPKAIVPSSAKPASTEGNALPASPPPLPEASGAAAPKKN